MEVPQLCSQYLPRIVAPEGTLPIASVNITIGRKSDSLLRCWTITTAYANSKQAVGLAQTCTHASPHGWMMTLIISKEISEGS